MLADHGVYEQVYQGRLTVDGLVESMVACRQGSPRDRQLFQAVLNVIYEEFQFLHNFPDKELQMTAQVLASLVSARVPFCFFQRCVPVAESAQICCPYYHCCGRDVWK